MIREAVIQINDWSLDDPPNYMKYDKIFVSGGSVRIYLSELSDRRSHSSPLSTPQTHTFILTISESMAASRAWTC